LLICNIIYRRVNVTEHLSLSVFISMFRINTQIELICQKHCMFLAYDSRLWKALAQTQVLLYRHLNGINCLGKTILCQLKSVVFSKAMPNRNFVKRQLKFDKPRYLFTKTHKPKTKTQIFYDDNNALFISNIKNIIIIWENGLNCLWNDFFHYDLKHMVQ